MTASPKTEARAASRPSASSPPSRSFAIWLWEWTKSIVVALLVWFVLRTFLVEAFRIPSGSMENTLLIGDFLFVNKALYGAEVPLVHAHFPAFREPQRNDILVFDSVEEEGLKVVKRLVGMPGDTLWMENGELWRNGEKLDEPYVIHTDPTRSEDPVQRVKMREWQLPHLVKRDPANYKPDLQDWSHRRAPRLLLHDGRQPRQLVRRALLGLPASPECPGPPPPGLLQLRFQQLALPAVCHGDPVEPDLHHAGVDA